MTKPPANVLELPLEVRAGMALRAAYEKVVEDAVRDGHSISVWRDGAVFEVPPEELRALIASRK